jgi:pimeloyl-ACP methyl ester carboxylesterase
MPKEIAMQRLHGPGGGVVSYDRYGSGPPLVLVHGSFSDHDTNWEFVKPILRERFTVYAVARRGRGLTPATVGHHLEDERNDLVAVVRMIGEPVFLLGHSHGAHCALAAAAAVPARIRKLVLYEPIWPDRFARPVLARLEQLAEVGAWDEFSFTFFRDMLRVPVSELAALRKTRLWPPIIADARASLGDIRAIMAHRFEPAHYRHLAVPTLLQTGSDSPRELYVTDALAAALPDAHIQVLHGQAHEGMTTAPDLYASAVTEFFLESSQTLEATGMHVAPQRSP